MKKIIIGIIVVLVLVAIGLGIYIMLPSKTTTTNTPGGNNGQNNATTTVATTTQSTGPSTIIGKSVEGRTITAYHYGTGSKELLFVGGIHGGYEWNTVLVAYELMDYLKQNPGAVPAGVKVTVIPVLNPDGLYKVVGTTDRFAPVQVSPKEATVIAGRFNAHEVDLNRNFDCDWQSTGVWQDRAVSGGSKAFSEPESQAIRDYVLAHKPTAAVAYYSAVGGVFASNCHNGVSAETRALTSVYAKAAGYRAYDNFDFYEITGDMVNWFAKNNIPAISVLLTTHESVEWNKNLAGIKAVLNRYK